MRSRDEVVDVVVRWRGDVIAVERLDHRALLASTVVVGPVRLDVARLALPCTMRRGPFVVSIRADAPAPNARAAHDVDPVLVRAAGVPLVLAAGVFAALSATAPRVDGDVFAFDLHADGTRGSSTARAPRASSPRMTVQFARATARAPPAFARSRGKSPQMAPSRTTT